MYRLLPFSLNSSVIRGRKGRQASAALATSEGTARALGEHNAPLYLPLTVKLMIAAPGRSSAAS
jgi:hypothetical protein